MIAEDATTALLNATSVSTDPLLSIVPGTLQQRDELIKRIRRLENHLGLPYPADDDDEKEVDNA